MSTVYHSQYWAHALTLRGSGGDIAALSRSIANARVDLNPHQIDAQDAIDQQREELIGNIEKQLKHTCEVRTLFTIRWRVA